MNTATLTDKDIYLGLSGLELAVDEIELGQGVVLRRTYAHLMAPFVMAFSATPPENPILHHGRPLMEASLLMSLLN